jgi:hypothetical protein
MSYTVGLIRRLLLPRVLFRLVPCCSYSRVQLYGLYGFLGQVFSCSNVRQFFMCSFAVRRCNLLGDRPSCLFVGLLRRVTSIINDLP